MEATARDAKRMRQNVMLDPDVRRKLRQIAADNDKSFSDAANDALRAALKLPKPAA